MKILVADDDPLLQQLTSVVLRSEGFEVVQARDGGEAMERFLAERPDIILTDYEMPGVDGLEFMRRVRAVSGNAFIPMIMLTGSTESRLLQESTQAGAIEFLNKPFKPEELTCRIRAIAELTQAHKDLEVQKERDDEELGLVKHVLSSLTVPGRLALPKCMAMETLATVRINGDACAYRMGLPNVHFGLICDATGHGLMAGVSTIPVLEAFLSMVSRDVSLEVIYREVNHKLAQLMPTGRFACMILFRMDVPNGVLSVLNAGMPDAFLFRQDGGQVRLFESHNLPAGILRLKEPPVVEETNLAPGDRFLAYSDGLLDLMPAPLIQQHLLVDFMHLTVQEHQAKLHDILHASVEDKEQHDDLSWALWECPALPTVLSPMLNATEVDETALSPGLTMRFQLKPRINTVRDLLPDIQNILVHQGIPQYDLRTLAFLLTEVLTNAVDHGVLRLDSALKEHGFEAYDAERKARLEGLETYAQVELTLELLHDERGNLRKVCVAVKDTGPGFDWRTWFQSSEAPAGRPSGRGLLLVKSLGRDLSFNEVGNEVRFSLVCQT